MNSKHPGHDSDGRHLVIAGALTPADWILRERVVDALERSRERWRRRDPAAAAIADAVSMKPLTMATGTAKTGSSGPGPMKTADPGGGRRGTGAIDDDDDSVALVPRMLAHDRLLASLWSSTTTMTAGGAVAAGGPVTPRWSALRTLRRPPDDVAAPAVVGRDETATPAAGTAPWRWSVVPAHFHFGGDHLRYVDGAVDDLMLQQAHDLVAAVQPLFADLGRTLHVLSATRWAIDEAAVDEAHRWQLDCATREAVAGRPVDAYLPEGRDARAFRRLLNEVQMTWHDHPVNVAREAVRQAPVNAIWLDGPVDAAAFAAWDTLTGDGRIEIDDTLLHARLVDDPARWLDALPAVIDRLVAELSATRGVRRCVLCGDVGAMHCEPASGWRAGVDRLIGPLAMRFARRTGNGNGNGNGSGTGVEAGGRPYARNRGLFALASWIEEPGGW